MILKFKTIFKMKSIIIVFISIFSIINDVHSQNPTQEDIKKNI